jgi:hypothetical protein
MKTNLKKLLLLTSAIAVAMPLAVATAATTNIDAVAKFVEAITLGNEVDMDFGQIEFSGAPGAGDTVTLTTAGGVTYAGVFDGGGAGTAGSVEVTVGTVGETVDVFCDNTATMTRTGGGSIGVDNIQVNVGAGAVACQGIGSAATTRVLAGGDVFTFGGRINGATAAGFVAGDYSTANAGGDNIQIDVFYQ